MQDNSSCRRCILGITHDKAAGVCFRSKREAKRRHLCRTQWRPRARSPSSASSSVRVFASSSHGSRPSRFKVSLWPQAQVLSCCPGLLWQRAGNIQAQGLKRSQGRARPQRVAGQGMRVTAPQRGPAALEGGSMPEYTGTLPGLALRDVNLNGSGDAGSPGE